MDPLATIGLVANIIDFIQIGVTVFSNAREIYQSASGYTTADQHYDEIMKQMENFSGILQCGDPSSPDDKNLHALAEECGNLAGDIRRVLSKSKPKDRSLVRVISASWNGWKNEKKRMGLQNRFENCRSQLALQFNYIASRDIKSELRGLTIDHQKIEEFRLQVEKLCQGVTLTSISPECEARLRQMLELPEEILASLNCNRILNSLAFADMHARVETIPYAHSKTFEWIFDDSPGSNPDEDLDSDMDNDRESHTKSDPILSQIQRSFVSWLSSDSGIFHVAGKMGSGKSTLMKFLCRHKKTQAILTDWANGRQLVFASFFFWRPGSYLQKSMDGLYRSLLYESLQSAPDLIPDIFPETWNHIRTIPWQAVEANIDIRADEVRAGFNRLIHCKSLYTTHSLCFFIDGLDEYEENANEDYTTMVKKICQWSDLASGNVKVCVSSREYNVFENHFPPDRRIRLQDLTKKDIDQYIRDKLDFLKEEAMVGDLVSLISYRANGIFLWVALVVKRLREISENHSDVRSKKLEKEVEEFPQGLDELFHHILQSLHPSDRKRAYQTFAIVLTVKKEPRYAELPLLAYYFFEKYGGNLDYEQIPSIVAQWSGEETKEHRILQARKMLMGRCKDLIEVGQEGGEEYLTFAHRSIPEFLESSAIQSEMADHLQGFSPEEAISQCFLAFLWESTLKLHKNQKFFLDLYAPVIYLRHRANLDKWPFAFEEQCEAARSQSCDYRNLAKGPNLVEYSCFNTMFPFPHLVYADDSDLTLIVDVFHLSAYAGSWEYVIWKVAHDPSLANTPFEQVLLLYCSIFGYPRTEIPKQLPILDLLLERGLSPQTLTGLYIVNTKLDGPPLTVFQHLILFAFRTFFDDRNAILEIVPFTLYAVWERLLECGADPHLSFSATILDGEKRQRPALKIKLIVGQEPAIAILQPFYLQLSDHKEFQRYRIPGSDEFSMTLTDIVNFCHPPNQETLLSLIENYSPRQDSDEDEKIEKSLITTGQNTASRLISGTIVIAVVGVLLAAFQYHLRRTLK
ncbi:hypothetical protein BDV28DRAFT_148013 [Aspergillus coremiiformis]|uniref:Uncharacterized protein n=1 Tax=Aspergillus coremiiformis TaxID=138285 RepID=A0A5N6Z8L1_9EURO|nr:hypothetical protein BDV28DRAFT_148013 [Aspergillus coremiiformis]